MQKLGIICENQIDPHKIAVSFSQQDEMNARVYHEAITLVGEVNDGQVDGLVFGVSGFSPEKVKILDVIKEKLPSFPIVLASRSLDTPSRVLADHYQQFTVVKYPEELPALGGIFGKMFVKEKVSTRLYTRYDVQLPAELTIGNTEIHCLLSNLSRGGAQVSIPIQSIKEGEKATLYVPLFGEMKSHNVAAKVVWTKADDPQTILGLEFSSPNDYDIEF